VWTLVDGLNESVANVGFAVIALFAIAWLVSVVLYRRIFEGGRHPTATKALECADATEAA
jgi:high-affinity nickel-transport protein